MSMVISCLILFSLGGPVIKGFAVTLGLGVVISMFTAITVSRTFMSVLIGSRFGKNVHNYGFEEVTK